MDVNNVSAFAAYSSLASDSPVAAPKKRAAAATKKATAATTKPTAAAKKKSSAAAANKQSSAADADANVSFEKLSHADMIARLIGKKKDELKRKSEGHKSPKKSSAAKRKKTAAAAANGETQSASTSINVEPAADAATAGGAKNSSRNGGAGAIKIHPKNPERLTMFLSKGAKGNKSTTKSAAAKAAPAAVEQSLMVFGGPDMVQSTPIANGAGDGQPQRKVNGSSVRRVKPELQTPIRTPASITDVTAGPPPSTTLGSIEAGRQLLAWIIHPTTVDDFMRNAWEQTPLLIDRKCPTYYSQLLSTPTFDRMLREQRVEFTKNLDITSYVDGVRQTHNPEGRAMPPTVWDFYAQGCSIRLLNPQTFLPVVHSMNATLQEYFQCMTGANVYLTPANSQGFAPHYDDIEAFVLQLEGKKHWKVYKPRTTAEQLPRESSPNFKQAEIGQPILDVILEAGDLLYFPRGFIHQATTVPGHHSLHITLSAYQKNSYADLLEHLVPAMLQSSIADAVLLRRGLPMNVWQCAGLVHSDDAEDADAAALEARRSFLAQVRTCLDLTMKSFEQHVDDAVDRLAVRFQHDALPPHLAQAERACTVYGTAAATPGAGAVEQALPTLETPVRLVRANILRLVRHSAEEFRIYYHADNSREYHEYEQQFVEISAEDAPAVEYLVKAYPAFSRPSAWPIEDDEQCLAVAQDLWERGLLLTDGVLE